ncbi:MAG: DNA repair protein RecN [Gammaproteobacteria bacterium]
MLIQLTIQNFALVDQLDIDLHEGMTAITGETGAGKSIMLDALGLALGDRADPDAIRSGAERADISATFSLGDNEEALHWLREHDFPEQDDLCILRRVLTRDGRSRAYINGQSTTLAELKTLGEMLIDIHSQHEHQSLLKTATHQRLLDAFGGLQDAARKVQDLAMRARRLQQEITTLKNASATQAAQIELLGFQVKELDELRLQADELPALEAEHKQLSHADEALGALQEVLALCNANEDFNLEQALRRATSLLEDLPFRHPLLDEAGTMLSTALIQVEEAGSSLLRASERIEQNPERLAEVDERLGLIHRLARKHKVAPADLYAHAQQLGTQLAGLSGAEGRAEELEKELSTLLADYRKSAGDLSQKRAKTAKQLEKAVNAQLARLGMANAVFSLDLHTNKDAEPAPQGYDAAEFLVSTNPGQPPRPLAKIASGGELSRISLAIQVVTAQTSSIPTLVFDEVDVGIGGGTARAVGELLHELGARGQILCVTHQPQVASQAHQHLLVSKSSSKNATVTSLVALDKKQRITEIARMLGGDALTDKSLAHAKELLSQSAGA